MTLQEAIAEGDRLGGSYWQNTKRFLLDNPLPDNCIPKFTRVNDIKVMQLPVSDTNATHNFKLYLWAHDLNQVSSAIPVYNRYGRDHDKYLNIYLG